MAIFRIIFALFCALFALLPLGALSAWAACRLIRECVFMLDQIRYVEERF